MRNITVSVGIGLALWLMPSILPIPSRGPDGFAMLTDQAEAACTVGSRCYKKCYEAAGRGYYMTVADCQAAWGPRNDQAAAERRQRRD